MIYEWKKGSQIKGDPQAVGEELDRLKDHYKGKLKPQIILAAAKRKKSPLHDCFEWDDTAAAKQYRLDQARFVLRCIVYIVAVKGNEKPVRCFVSIKDDEADNNRDRVYVDTLDALENEATAGEVIGEIKSELSEITSKLKTYNKIIVGTKQATKHIDRAQNALSVGAV